MFVKFPFTQIYIRNICLRPKIALTQSNSIFSSSEAVVCVKVHEYK